MLNSIKTMLSTFGSMFINIFSQMSTRRITLAMLESFGQGPGHLYTDAVEIQAARLQEECRRKMQRQEPCDAYRYCDQAIDSVLRSYRLEGLHVRRALSRNRWNEYPQFEFSQTPFSPLSRVWNCLTRSSWYALAIPLGVLCFLTLLVYLCLLAAFALWLFGVVNFVPVAILGVTINYILFLTGFGDGYSRIPYFLAGSISVVAGIVYLLNVWRNRR